MAGEIDFSALGAEAQIDPKELAALRAAKAFLDEVRDDPEARPHLIRAYKKKHPNEFIPEHDVAERVRAEITEAQKPVAEQLAALKKEREEESARKFWDAAKSKAEAAGVDFGDVQNLMTSQGITNPDVAVAYLKSQAKVTPETYNWRTSVETGGEEEKGLLEDPRGWARQMAHSTIAQLKREQAA